jgi:hypothetical protein
VVTLMPRPLRRRAGLHTHHAELRRLERLAAGSAPIVAGPWTGELGTELLYWIPFLRWLTTEGGVAPERIVAVSRGDVGAWYATVSGRYVELLDHFSVPRVMRWRRELDRHAVDLAQKVAGVARAERVQPLSLRRLFATRWELGAPSSIVSARTVHAPLPIEAGEHPELAQLPRPYVAVKLYFNANLPDTPETRSILQRTVARLAAQTNVVLLPEVLGEHEPFILEPGTQATAVSLEAQRNLAVQTQIVRDATALVSTYGGFSYLGPYVGTPTLALYSAAPSGLAHLDLIDRVGRQLGQQPARLFRARHIGALRTEASAE